MQQNLETFEQTFNAARIFESVLIQGSRLWSVKVEEQIWRRHENQIRQRYWSTDDDLIVTHQSTESADCDDDSSSFSPSDQQSKVLRRSSRSRKPVHCLIEQI
ncbi:unnamed protein product [Rotaria socialis]|uniref:Uncharacterized protein n=1 Tax=Rotaria socialis TaxID=392032 RepID=A0A820JPP7_9BILA|nr:unnamed protein product [Rotaria socialis]CAF4266045.1 unnamed protein product [Rotaria socialis]CAF4329644.1 unnamed protein product [Rotaria socialis]